MSQPWHNHRITEEMAYRFGIHRNTSPPTLSTKGSSQDVHSLDRKVVVPRLKEMGHWM